MYNITQLSFKGTIYTKWYIRYLRFNVMKNLRHYCGIIAALVAFYLSITGYNFINRSVRFLLIMVT